MTIDFIFRLFVAGLLGGAIGLEREYRAKEAGFRTHFLVSLGSALFMIISQYGFDTVLAEASQASFDPSRIASQVVTGIGFLGAGAIIFQKHVVKGLTTAAGIWVTAAIGLTCGSGLYLLATATTVLVLICLEALHMVLHRFGTRALTITYTAASKASIANMLKKLREDGVTIDSYDMQERHTTNGGLFKVTMEVKVKRSQYQDRILDFMADFDGVTIENME